MSIRNLRTYIDAPTPANVNVTDWPLPETARERLDRLITYIYGDSRGRGRVIPESRMLRDLGRVLADPSGRAQRALDQSHNLTEALDALTEPSELALKRLNAALNGLRRVVDDGPNEFDQQSAAVIRRLADTVQELETRLVDPPRVGGQLQPSPRLSNLTTTR